MATHEGGMVTGFHGVLSGLAFHFAGIANAIFRGKLMSVFLMFKIPGPSLTWIFVWLPALIHDGLGEVQGISGYLDEINEIQSPQAEV